MRDLLNENVQEGKIIINIRLSSLPNQTYWQPLNFISNLIARFVHHGKKKTRAVQDKFNLHAHIP